MKITKPTTRPIALLALLFILLLNSFVTRSYNNPLQPLDNQYSKIKNTLTTCQLDGALGGAIGSIILPLLGSICLDFTHGQTTFFTVASAVIGSLIGYSAGYGAGHKSLTKSKPDGIFKEARCEAFKTGFRKGTLTSTILAVLVIPKDYELKQKPDTDFDTYSPRSSN